MSRRMVLTQLICGFVGCLFVDLSTTTLWTVRWWLQLGLNYAVFLVLATLTWGIVFGSDWLARKVRARCHISTTRQTDDSTTE